MSIRACLVAAVLLAQAVCVQAGDEAAPLPWKLTIGEYTYTDYAGTDVNLRWHVDDSSAWVGAYSDRVFGTQARAGADTSIKVSPYVQVQPSLQAASMGFLGGSINVQAGASWYGLVGFGRTDARPYFNLNFDPNDALTFGAGHHAENGVSYLVFVVADDRFHTGQRDWHATFDLMRKSGLTDAGPITGWGFIANWDWPRWFLRLAYDPHQNFSAQDAWRFATGIRF